MIYYEENYDDLLSEIRDLGNIYAEPIGKDFRKKTGQKKYQT